MLPYKTYSFGKLQTSEIEVRDLTIAWIILSMAFATMFTGFSFSFAFLKATLFAAITAGVGFVLHELGHKIVAQRFGCFAEFRASYPMLLFAVLLSFFGFLFAAPGAVMIQGQVDRRKNGLISLAGPLVNVFLSLLFLLFSFISVHPLFLYGFIINAWLAFFNMLPFPFFDGAKVWVWNKKIYTVIFLISGVLIFAQQILFVE